MSIQKQFVIVSGYACRECDVLKVFNHHADGLEDLEHFCEVCKYTTSHRPVVIDFNDRHLKATK